MKIFYAILLTFFSITLTQAQYIEEGSRSVMAMGSQNSMSLTIPSVDAKVAKKVWTKYLKSTTKGGKTKTDKKSDVIFTDNTLLTAIGGANTVDIYMLLSQTGADVNATIWFDLGGAFLNSEGHGEKYTEGEKFLMRFAIEVAIEDTKIELKEEEKKASDLAKDLSNLQKKKEGYHKEIEIAENKIKVAEANIEQNIKDQEVTDKAILDQAAVIEAVKARLAELEN